MSASSLACLCLQKHQHSQMNAASVKWCWDTMLFVRQADVSLLLLLAMLLAPKHVCIFDLDDNRTPTSHHAHSIGFPLDQHCCACCAWLCIQVSVIDLMGSSCLQLYHDTAITCMSQRDPWTTCQPHITLFSKNHSSGYWDSTNDSWVLQAEWHASRRTWL